MSQTLIACCAVAIFAAAALGYALGWRQRAAWPDVLDLEREDQGLEARVRRSQQ